LHGFSDMFEMKEFHRVIKVTIFIHIQTI